MCWQPSFPIFYFNDHGFGEGKSCLTNLCFVNLSGRVNGHVDMGESADTAYLDFRNYFKSLLPKKKSSYGRWGKGQKTV